jgi:hypothetical protein
MKPVVCDALIVPSQSYNNTLSIRAENWNDLRPVLSSCGFFARQKVVIISEDYYLSLLNSTEDRHNEAGV